MKIGIIGSGNIGATSARLFARAGYEVALSNSRGGEGLEALVAELRPKAQATTIGDAARFGEVVLVAIPFGKFRMLPREAFQGKVVIDAFRLINPHTLMMGQEPRQTTSNVGHLNKPSIQALIHGLNRHYYSIGINYRKTGLEENMLMNLLLPQELVKCWLI